MGKLELQPWAVKMLRPKKPKMFDHGTYHTKIGYYVATIIVKDAQWAAGTEQRVTGTIHIRFSDGSREWWSDNLTTECKTKVSWTSRFCRRAHIGADVIAASLDITDRVKINHLDGFLGKQTVQLGKVIEIALKAAVDIKPSRILYYLNPVRKWWYCA